MRALVVTSTLLFALLATDARAAEPVVSVKTTVNADVVRAGDTFQIDVVVTVRTNAALDELALPDLSQFTVLRDARADRSSVKLVAGQRAVTQETTYTFLVSTSTPGTKQIGPAVARLGNLRARSEPITITVLKDEKRGKRPRKKGEPYVLELTFDKESVYVGEQSTLSARVFATGPAELRPISMPKLPQFWVEGIDQGGGRPTERTVDGTHYYVYPLHTAALFPLAPGEHTVEPLDVSVTVGGGMWSRGKVFTVTSDPVTLRVKPLPDGAPVDFSSGNVGRFSMKMRADPLRTSLGRPVTVEIVVSGTGNNGTVVVPALPDRIEGARVFPPTFDEAKSIVDGRVAMTKSVRALVQPTRAGRLTIPGTRFVFFDPETERYEVREATPITIVVDEADAEAEREASGGRARIAKGARPIATHIDASSPFAPYRSAAFFPLVGALSLVGGLAALLGAWRVRRRASGAFALSAARRRRRDDMHRARDERDLARARVLVEDALAARAGDDVRALSVDRLKETLAARGVDEAAAARATRFFLDVETVLYAPAAGVDRRALFDEALAILALLEGES